MPKTLLLADDSVTIQKVVGISFANEDVVLLTVDNGDDAIRRAREARPDIVLADVVMPGKNGYEVCEALKADPQLSGIPVLLLTGTFEAFDEDRAARAGADGHITKPFEAQALVDQVNTLLAGSSAAAARAADAGPDVADEPVSPSADTAYDFFEDEVTSPGASGAGDTSDATVIVSHPAEAVGGAASGSEAFGFEADGDLADGSEAPPRQQPPTTPLLPTHDDRGDDARTVGLLHDDPEPFGAGSDLELDGPEEAPVASFGIDDLETTPSRRDPQEQSAARLFDDEAPPPEPRAFSSDDGADLMGDDDASATRLLGDDDDASATRLLGGDDASATRLLGDDDASATRLLDDDDVREEAATRLLADEPRSDAAASATRILADEADPFLDAPLGSDHDALGFDEAPARGVFDLDDAPSRAFDLDEAPARRAYGLEGPARDAAAVTLAPEEALGEAVLDPSPGRDYDVSSSDLGAPLAPPPARAEAPAPTTPSAAEAAGAPLSPQLRQEVSDAIEKIAWEAFGQLTEQLVKEAVERVERVAWEVVPQLTEAILKEEIRKLKGE